MLTLISPAKSLSYQLTIPPIKPTIPDLKENTFILASHFKKLSAKDLEKLMKISQKLAELNYERFQKFSQDFNNNNSRSALFLFDGDVYQAMSIKDYKTPELNFAQNNLRILSGFYGILRPLDLIQEYRLEMGTTTKSIIGKNLPEFWREKITANLNHELKSHQDKTLINLASEEYSSAINEDNIDGKIINIIFKQKSGQGYKTIGIFAKKARGLMADFIIKNKIEKSEDLKKFNTNGYKFKQELSNENNWTFYN
jgi:cytoplasmic iron level regulating protein YaaA (DUF328/UPF0246 family)